MNAHYWIRARFGLKPVLSPVRKGLVQAKPRLMIEALEDRTLLTGTPLVTLQLIPASGSSLPAATLALDSYQFGFESPTTIGSATSGAGAGKITFDDLTVAAPLSGASPQLFKVLATGGHYDTAVLTQRNAADAPEVEWVLGTAFVTSDGIADASTAVPAEAFHLIFGSVTEVTSANTASWNQLTNLQGGPTPPSGVTLAALPVGSAPALTLELQPASGSSLPAATLSLNSYQFGFESPTTIGSATSGAGAGKITFDDLTVAAPLSGASPQLFKVLATGGHYDTAVLTQRNAAGDAEAEWALGTVFLTSDGIAGASTAVPAEAFHLIFGSVTEVTSANTVSWNQLTNLQSGPTPPSGVTLAALPVIGAPALTLELQPASGSSLPAATLALNSYQFGFESPTTIGSATSGAGAGKITFDDLKVSAPLSGASPQLFNVLATGSHYDTAVLTQRNAAGDAEAEWALGTVFLTSDVIAGAGAAVPAEALQLIFGSLTEVTSANTASWNQLTNLQSGPTPPSGVTLAALPVGSAPALTLELQPASGSSLPAATLSLNSYQFGFESPTTIGSATSGAGAGKITFDDLTVSAPLSGASPQLFKVLATGGHYDTAVLTQRNAAGDPEAEWALGTVFLTSDGIAGAGAAVPAEALQLIFGSLTEVTSANTASWNQLTNLQSGPTPPSGVTLAALPVISAPALTLELQPASGSSLPAATLALNSYQFGFESPTTIGSATSGAGAGKITFDDLKVSAPLSGASPQLFNVLATGSHYDTAVLTQRNAAGDAEAEWALGTVFLTSDGIAGASTAVPAEAFHLIFGSVTEVTSANTVSWNQLTNLQSGPTPPSGVTLAALPVGSAPALTLELQPASGSSLPAATLSLNSYQFGFESPTTIGSATSGAGAGKITFDDLTVSAPLSGASPQLFKVLATGGHYDTAVLTQRNAAGDAEAEWALGTVFLTSDVIAGAGTAVPAEALHLIFGALTEVTSANTASWNQLTNLQSGPTPPSGVTLVPIVANVTISGVVFRDFNSNGKQDGNEPALSGQTVFLDLNNNGVPDNGEPIATTTSTGAYSFLVSEPNTYIVRELALGGSITSVPSNGSYSLTVASGSNLIDENFGNVLTSITIPLTLPPNAPFPSQGNANADYVEAIYRAVLDRNADSGGLSSWTGSLNSGQLTRLQVVQGIRNSPEHFGQEIDVFYRTLLGRAADPQGRANWVQQLANGVREEQIAFDFLNSPEYLSKGDKFFVDAMYLSLLGRAFDPAGEASWLNALGDDSSGNPTHAPTLTHAQVINDFLYSAESLDRLVEGYYEVFLQRQADPGGLNGWVTELQAGLPFLTIGQEFISSDEFFNKAAGNE